MALPRDRNRPRHRSPTAQPRAAGDGPDPDPELVSYLAALAPTDTPGPTEITGRFGTTQVLQLRMSALQLELLRRLAEKRGVAPADLAAEWVIERLTAEDTDTGPIPQVEDEPRRRFGWRGTR